MEDRGGRLDLVLPYATLEPVRELLLQMFMGEKFGRDSIWESHLTSELWQTDLKIEAVLDDFEVSLGDVLNWAVGSRLALGSVPSSPVRLRCGDVNMFIGHMGRRGNHIAVRVSERMPS
jgi:flagellar motor switch protein FliM